VRGIDDDLEVVERHAGRQRRPAKVHVIAARAHRGLGSAERARVARDRRRIESGLDGFLESVRKLLPFRIEEFDAVVVIGVVRCADDDAEVGIHLLREHRNGGSRQRAREQHVDACGHEPGLERGLEHVTRNARVLTDEHRAAFRCEHTCRGAREAQREIDGHGCGSDLPADAVGAEVAACHCTLCRRSRRTRCDGGSSVMGIAGAGASAGRPDHRGARCLCRP